MKPLQHGIFVSASNVPIIVDFNPAMYGIVYCFIGIFNQTLQL